MMENKQENEEVDNDFLDDGVMGENIFQTDEAVEGMKRQAEALGIDPESVDLSKEQKVLYARKNCKSCYGRGAITFVPSPSKSKKIKLNIASAIEKRVRQSRIIKTGKGKRRQIRRKPTQKRLRIRTELPGNTLDKAWNTRKPEPFEFKQELLQHTACRCVRTLEL